MDVEFEGGGEWARVRERSGRETTIGAMVIDPAHSRSDSKRKMLRDLAWSQQSSIRKKPGLNLDEDLYHR